MEHPIVKVHQGQLRGMYDTSINGTRFTAFRGIPYAKAPIGQLRFKDSEPVESWSGLKDAIKFGDRCAQQFYDSATAVGSDDCLYLNVYTTTLKPPKPRAVMVWIHGGGFVCGASNDDYFGPDYLIEKNIVLVTINYRLGILGFLNVEHEVAPGNQGLKDQVQALRWIQQNIAAFGGDSKNVTIFGGSAGAASVHYLNISPLAQGLFHKAILQSAVAINPSASMSHSSIEIAEKLAKLVDKDISDPEQFVEYLQTLDVSRLIELSNQLRTPMEKVLYLNPFLPSVDSKAKTPFLSVPLKEAIKCDIKVPSIIGYVANEGILFAAGFNERQIEEINNDHSVLLVPPIVVETLKEYNLTPSDVNKIYLGDEKITKQNMDKFVDLLSASSFLIGIHSIIERQWKNTNVPTYIYKLNGHSEAELIKTFLNTNLKGICHGEELFLLFYPKFYQLNDIKPAKPGSTEFILIRRFIEMWTNFAKTGNPTIRITDEIPVLWQPIDDPIKYNCLMIAEELTMDVEINILYEMKEKIKIQR